MPPFNSGSAYPRTQKMRVLVDVFEVGKVDIVFSSYIHVYQRSAPLLFQPTHLPQGPVRDYGHERVEVEFQHNGHDCGLYMLEYVRRLAQHQTDLTAAKRRGRNGGMHWNDHEVLRFTSDEVDSLFRACLLSLC